MKPGIIVNGHHHSLEGIEDREMLGDFLRDKLDLTGTHLGCEHGICGACTVSIDGQAARSCITLARACSGAQVLTIEGFDADPLMARLRHAFKEEHALQCGYCTPGMLIAARDLILRHPEADERTIRLEMSGNLCRCTGYMGIVAAIKNVLGSLTTEEKSRYLQNTLGDSTHLQSNSLGPVGSHTLASDRAVSNLAAPEKNTRRHDQSEAIRPDLETLLPSMQSLIRIQEAFEVNASRKEAWTLISQISNVAPCLPGLTVGEQLPNDVFEVSLKVNLGPISTNFAGFAHLVTKEEDFSGLVYGKAKDQKSGTSAQGEIRFRILEGKDPLITSVGVEIGYSLSGPLAQFSRGSIAKDIAKNLTQSFGKNMNNLLTGETHKSHEKPRESDALSITGILISVLRVRLKALTYWFFKKN